MLTSTQSAEKRTFDASHTAVAFPLGGIGTGNVSLGSRGDLRDWEIFNTSAKGNVVPNTFFAIRLQLPGQEPVMRVLEGELQPPYLLSHGYHPSLHGGLPRFRQSSFRGEYPFAWVTLDDPDVPVRVELEAFTPLIPLNPDDSGIPCAILSYTVSNTSDQPVSMTLAASLCNPVGGIRFDPFLNIGPSKEGRTTNEMRDEAAFRGLFMTAEGIESDSLNYGSMSLTTDSPNVTIKPHWLRSGWWDYLQEFWDDLADDGQFTDLGFDGPSPDGRPDTGSLGITATLEPGAKQTFRFVLAWHFPNRRNSWRVEREIENVVMPSPDAPTGIEAATVRNHYVTHFSDAWEVARYAFTEWPRLETETRNFHNAWYSSTLPAYVVDRITATIVPVRSNTCFWLEDGRFYGWEGCFDDAGCCPGSCTHVWSYAYTVAYLFPSLEREMRRIEFEIETDPDGFMNFRNHRSMGEEFVWIWNDQRPEAASDGQLGSILRVYREWLLSGDTDWLRQLWPAVKRAIDFASRQWDTDGDFVLDGKQHNTYDIEFYGPNPLSGIHYLAALRAVEAMARILGEETLAERCRNAYEIGSQKLDALLWNDDYFVQFSDDVNAYKYQHGLGCLADQLLGQLHAHSLGLGDLLPRDHVHKAIKAVFDHNFRTDFHNHSNAQRTYVLNDESGLLMCTWPHGGRPNFPFPYSDEVWTGTEYQVAAELIYDGWLDEGLRMVKAIYDRHDGLRRNPWDEVECGHHYARSMASWAVLLALSGQQGAVANGILSFDPVLDASDDPNEFRCFWSNGRAWGSYVQRRNNSGEGWTRDITILGGNLEGVALTTGDRAGQGS
jgi:non-lysosomal glucosylceramidase